MMPTFALIGAAGFVAKRHLQAISDVGGQLVAALDLHDSVGILDNYFPDCRFFTSPERFDRYLNKMSGEIDYVVICSPNWLHDAHCRWALRSGADAICEKPVVLRPWNVEQLVELEQHTNRRIHPILQLRLHPNIVQLKNHVLLSSRGGFGLKLNYVTRRGRWYTESWKGDESKSGGILMNLGIHFFDLACWLFGEPQFVSGKPESTGAWRGRIEFLRAEMEWFLSSRIEDLPAEARHAYRRLEIDGDIVDFSEGFNDLHTIAYRNILDDEGPSLLDALPGIELVHQIREGAK